MQRKYKGFLSSKPTAVTVVSYAPAYSIQHTLLLSIIRWVRSVIGKTWISHHFFSDSGISSTSPESLFGNTSEASEIMKSWHSWRNMFEKNSGHFSFFVFWKWVTERCRQIHMQFWARTYFTLPQFITLHDDLTRWHEEKGTQCKLDGG